MVKLVDLKPGKSVEQADIHALKSDLVGEKYLYLLAGVHGDEVEGIYLVSELLKLDSLWEKISYPLVIIPTLNVDGYRVGTRNNSNGVDLNRNLPSSTWSAQFNNPLYNPGPSASSESENQFLLSLFNKYPPKLAISFHSWKPLLNYNGNCLNIAQFISQINSYPVADSVGYATPGSLGDFLPEKYQAAVLTYELPRITKERGLKSIWDENQQALESLLTSGLIKKHLISSDHNDKIAPSN